MVANAGVASYAPISESKIQNPPIDISLIYVYHSEPRRMGPDYWHKRLRHLPLLRICWTADDQTGSGGKIVGASSIAGKQGIRGFPLRTSNTPDYFAMIMAFNPAYSASKFAVRDFTRAAGESFFCLFPVSRNETVYVSPRIWDAQRNHCEPMRTWGS